jgi:plastocyanin
MKTNITLRFSLMLGAAFLGLTSSAAKAADGWGTLTGQIVYDGKAPAAEAIQVTKDPEYCGKFGLKSEKLVVNPDNGGVANVGVWLSVAKTDKVKPTIHPDLMKLANEKVKMDNKNCAFTPHMIAVWKDQTVELGNADPVGHNTKIDTLNPANPALNQLIPAGKSMDQKFKAEENLPVKVSCNIHPWMSGWIIVRDTPYAVATDTDGKFTIEKLPVGKWRFRFWQEEIGYLQNVKVDGKDQKWKKGEVEIEIKDGETVDVGVVSIKKKD